MCLSRFQSGERNVAFVECCFILNNLLLTIQDSGPARDYLEVDEELVPDNDERVIDANMPDPFSANGPLPENIDVEDENMSELQLGKRFRDKIMRRVKQRGKI